jgi:16S rRNA (adenine1518-N6/adenine1519-N6)-dimethyltransferase
MKLSEMREILKHRDIQLTKALGQNFLHDANQLERIVNTGEVTETDKILEIGPGLGPLTGHLLKKAGHVLAIEKDVRLVEVLRERFADEPKLELLHEDAVEFLKNEARDWRDWKLVANLPYSVASPILVELACGERAPKRIVSTLQLEVARRLMAATDDDDYGILTLLIQLDFIPRDWFKIPPTCFFPSPDVDSACIHLERRPQPLLPENLRQLFYRIVKLAFSQRRKMMMKLLKQEWPKEQVEAAFARLGISLQERAEKVSLLQFVALTEILSTKPADTVR